jgi:YesN/AraC family two-component response regulator
MVSEIKPQLVLMDIVMPGMDGLSALRIIAAQHPAVRVAMVSSIGGMPSRAEEAFRLGAVQVLGKPFDRDILGALFDSVRQQPAAGAGEGA